MMPKVRRHPAWSHSGR